MAAKPPPPADPPPPPLSFAFSILRQAAGVKQKDAAQAAGFEPSFLSKLESGTEPMTPERGGDLLAAIAEERERLDVGLYCAALLLAAQSMPGWPVELSASVRRRIEAAAARAGRVAYETALEEGLRVARTAQAEEDRRRAAELWERLKARSGSARIALVEENPEYQSWALVERLCAVSIRAAASDADQALELAELALRVAERVAGEAAWRSLLAGYAWAHAGNARRVAGDLPAAEKAFLSAWQLWAAGSAADVGLLDGSRLLDLEASLLRDQKKLAAALERLDQALALCPAGEGRGRILIIRGTVLEQLGDYTAAVEALQEAEPWIDREREPRWHFGQRFNLAVSLCHLARYAEAEAILPELRTFAGTGDRGCDPVRLRWLIGRVDAGRGRRAEGMAALSRVRAEFHARERRYDEALAGMELAGLYLEEGRTAEVKDLVLLMEPVFRDQGVHAEAQKALELFRQAVELETLTVELVRRLVAYLYRAQHNPELRFEALG
jgi:tetratricopeptide (TPR) repeat protein